MFMVSGCYQDTAQYALGLAYKDACKGKIADLRKVLVGDALQQFGTEDGAKAICSSTATVDAKKIKLTDTMVSSTHSPDGLDKTRTYQVDVLNKDTQAALATATVDCDVIWYYERVGCGMHCSGVYQLRDSEDCYVSALRN
jgi:hypothetical protein